MVCLFVCLCCCSPANLLNKKNWMKWKKKSHKSWGVETKKKSSQQSVGVSQHAGTGGSGSGSTVTGSLCKQMSAVFHFWFACESSPVPSRPDPTRPVLRPRVRSVKLLSVHLLLDSSSTPRLLGSSTSGPEKRLYKAQRVRTAAVRWRHF